MRPIALFALALSLAPAFAVAQDQGAAVIRGATTAAAPSISAADMPRLGAINHWRNYQVGCWNPLGCVSPKEGVVFDAIGPLTGENDVFDGVSYNGFSQFVAERYDFSGGRWTGVGANEVVGGFWGAARMDTGSDPVDAGMMLFTTEFQTTGRNGMGLELDYTPNGSTALTRGLSVSPQGKGGVTIGAGYAQNNPYRYGAPADLGPGTLDAADSIATGAHFRSRGPAPKVSACGAGPTLRGTDAAGEVGAGGAVRSCTITFAKAYSSAPVCIVQTRGKAAPAAYVTSASPSSLKVGWDSPLRGGFAYICQDPS